MGCDDVIERPFRAMSHGEQKRVLIARALINEPKLMVLDEPCTGLDLAAFTDALLAGDLDQSIRESLNQ